MIYKTLHDIPIKVYHRIKETGDVSLLEYDTLAESIKNGINNYTPKRANRKELEDIFEAMKDEQLNKFGVSEDFKEIYFLRNDINKLYIQELDGDLSVAARLKMYESKLNFIIKGLENAGIDIETAQARERRLVERETGRNIDSMSAFDFYTDLKEICDNNRKYQFEEALKKLKHAS